MLVIHIVAGGGWTVTAVAEAALLVNGLDQPLEGKKAAAELSHFLDQELLVPCALTVTYTGLMLGMLTSWGLTRYRWVMAKLVLTIVGLIYGTFVLGTWLQATVDATHQRGDYGPAVAEIIGGWALVAGLLVVFVIAMIKPWGRSRNAKPVHRIQERRPTVWAACALVPLVDYLAGVSGGLMLLTVVGYLASVLWERRRLGIDVWQRV